MNACASSACCEVAVRPVPIAQYRLVRDDPAPSPAAPISSSAIHLPREHRFGDPAVALVERFAHAEESA
jgi:hypothetical protein